MASQAGCAHLTGTVRFTSETSLTKTDSEESIASEVFAKHRIPQDPFCEGSSYCSAFLVKPSHNLSASLCTIYDNLENLSYLVSVQVIARYKLFCTLEVVQHLNELPQGPALKSPNDFATQTTLDGEVGCPDKIVLSYLKLNLLW